MFLLTHEMCLGLQIKQLKPGLSGVRCFFFIIIIIIRLFIYIDRNNKVQTGPIILDTAARHPLQSGSPSKFFLYTNNNSYDNDISTNVALGEYRKSRRVRWKRIYVYKKKITFNDLKSICVSVHRLISSRVYRH